MRYLILFLASLSCWGQFSNAKKVAGMPPCSPTVTVNCVVNANGSGVMVGGSVTAGTFVARGAYSAGTTYAALDLVSYNGVTYVSIAGANAGHTPDVSPTWWATGGPKGADGAPGSNGAPGPTGPAGTISSNSGIFTNVEYDNGTCTTAATISPANGNRQKVTLTNAQACALTFTQPAGSTISIQLKVIQSSAGSYNGTISGGKWPGGTVPTITATSGAVDIATCYLDGTSAYCVATQDFR